MALKRLLRAVKESEERREAREDLMHHHAHLAPQHDESNWLVSYADMLPLLCGFFIMLFSMAQLDPPQFERVKEAMAKQFGGDYKSPSVEYARFATQILQDAGVEKAASVKSDASGVALTFQSTV